MQNTNTKTHSIQSDSPVDNGGGYARVGAGVWEISVLSPQLCYEPATSLKKKVY